MTGGGDRRSKNFSSLQIEDLKGPGKASSRRLAKEGGPEWTSTETIINESGMCFLVLGRRNLTDAQKTYLIGRQYEAQKMTVGGNRGNQYSKVASAHFGHLPKARTAEIVAAVGIHDGIDCSKLSSGFSPVRCRRF